MTFYFQIPDPFRWLEDPDSEQTQKFINDHNHLTQDYFETIKEREKILRKLNILWNYPKFYCPSIHGQRYFFYKNEGLQNQK